MKQYTNTRHSQFIVLNVRRNTMNMLYRRVKANNSEKKRMINEYVMRKRQKKNEKLKSYCAHRGEISQKLSG